MLKTRIYISESQQNPYISEDESRVNGQEGFGMCLVGLAGNQLLEALPWS